MFDNIGGSEMQMRTLGGYLLEQGHVVVYFFREFVPEKTSREIHDGAIVYRNERPHCLFIKAWALWGVSARCQAQCLPRLIVSLSKREILNALKPELLRHMCLMEPL